jgi:L-rhamnose mutarotase
MARSSHGIVIEDDSSRTARLEAVMQRVAFIINLEPGADPVEYKRRHDEIWPEMLDALRGAGIQKYSIFRDGSKLFAYLETDDVERMRATLASDPTNARWQAYMHEMIGFDLDEATGFPRLLPEMFHME